MRASNTSQVVSYAAPIQRLGQFHSQLPSDSSNVVTRNSGKFKTNENIQQPQIIT